MVNKVPEIRISEFIKENIAKRKKAKAEGKFSIMETSTLVRVHRDYVNSSFMLQSDGVRPLNDVLK